MPYGDRTSIIGLERHVHCAAGDQVKKFCPGALLKNILACPAGEMLKERPEQTDLVFVEALKNSCFIQCLNLSTMLTLQVITPPVA